MLVCCERTIINQTCANEQEVYSHFCVFCFNICNDFFLFFHFFSLIFRHSLIFLGAEKCYIKGFPRTHRKFIRVSFCHLINHTKYGILFPLNFIPNFYSSILFYSFSLGWKFFFFLHVTSKGTFRWLYMMKIKRRFCRRCWRKKF